MVTEKKSNKIIVWNLERNELQKKFCYRHKLTVRRIQSSAFICFHNE